MADKWPLADGVWSNAANWNGGTKPITGDVVYADNRIVAIDETPASGITLRNSARSGGTAGGQFTIAINLTLTLNVEGWTQTTAGGFLNTSGTANVTIIGNVTWAVSQSLDARYAINHASTGSLVVVGAVVSTSTRSSGGAIAVNAGGPVSIVGNVSSTAGSPAVSYFASSTLTITGNVTNSGSSATVSSVVAQTVNVIGNLIGGASYAVGNGNTSQVFIVDVVGNVSAGASPAVLMASPSGSVTVTGNLTNNVAVMAIYSPRLRLGATQPTYWQLYTPTGVDRRLYTADSVGGNPATSNVRLGTTYGPASELTGTLAVPPASAVGAGVPVDNTVGTAVWTAEQISAALAPLFAAYGS
jgi:hypothetical protein